MYGVNGKKFQRQYKKSISTFESWDQKCHAEDWLLFEENLSAQLSLDEVALSDGELYTVLTSKTRKGRKGALVAIIKGTQSETVIKHIRKLSKKKRKNVLEITLDMAGSMRLIATRCFANAKQTIDRFHVQKLALEALQEIRIGHRWEAMEMENKLLEDAKNHSKEASIEVFSNGDTLKQLLARSRYLLYRSKEKWSASQAHRAELLFERYPDIKTAYNLCDHLRKMYNQHYTKSVAMLKFARWFNEVEAFKNKAFNTLIRTIMNHYNEILNYFVMRSTNASAESFNAKIKNFRMQLRGVRDRTFFLFRLTKLYA